MSGARKKTNLCVVVSEVSADTIRSLAAHVDLNNIAKSNDLIGRKITAPTTTKKLLEKMIEATIENTKKVNGRKNITVQDF